MVLIRQARPRVAADDAVFRVERIDDLRRRLVRAGDEHVLATRLDQACRAHMQRRFLLLEIREAPRFHAVRCQDRRLGEQQLAQRVPHLVGGELVAASRCEHGIEHERHVRIVGEDLGDRRDVLDAPEHADLECVDRHVLEQRARLVRDPVGVDRHHAFDAERVLHGQRRHDRQRMTSHARECQKVGLQAGAARRIGSGEREHDRWKGGSVGCGHDDAARIAPRPV